MKNNLFIDVCCGICLLGVYPQLELDQYNIYFIYSGDNICSKEEYDKRKEVFLKVCEYYKIQNHIEISYNHYRYLDFIKGYEKEKEGGYRCLLCFEYRFNNLFENLKNFQKDYYSIKDQILYFSTTLSVSRYKNYDMIKRAADNFVNAFLKESSNKDMKIKFYDKNFRNDQLYKNSIKVAKDLNLYRQNFCGCEFSKTRG